MPQYFLASVLLLFALCRTATSQDLNAILADPEKLIENRDIVVQVYRKFENSENQYPAMQKQFGTIGADVIAKHDALKKLWITLAKRLNEDARAQQLDNLSLLLSDSIHRLTSTPYNKYVDPMKDAASRVALVYTSLYELAVAQKDELDVATIQEFNAAHGANAAAVLRFVKYWNDDFKAVADGNQVRVMIREAVYRAKDASIARLLVKRDELEKQRDETRVARDKMLKEFIEKPELITEENTKQLLIAVQQLAEKDSDLVMLEKEINENKAKVKELLAEFGLR